MKFLPMRISSWLSSVRRSRAAKDRDLRDEVSIANIDKNATSAAATNQSARDAAAEKVGSPAEEGGEG